MKKAIIALCLIIGLAYGRGKIVDGVPLASMTDPESGHSAAVSTNGHIFAIILASDPTSNAVILTATASGNLKVANVEHGLSIAKGAVAGHSPEHKFGQAPSFSQGDGKITLWDGADDTVSWANPVYDYSTIANIDSLVSSSTANTQLVQITGLDANTNLTVQYAQLTGQTRVVLATPLYRVFRMVNAGATDIAGAVFCYTNNTLTAGVPNNPDSIRAIIKGNNNQTLMALYTIPAGKTGYVRSFFVATSAGNKQVTYIVRVYARPPNGVFQLKHVTSISDVGTSQFNHHYDDPPAFPAGTDFEITVQAAGNVAGASVAGGADFVLVDDGS